MAPKQKKRVSFSAGIETPDDLLSLPAVYRHPDPVLRRVRLEDSAGVPINDIKTYFAHKKVLAFYFGGLYGEASLRDFHRDLSELAMKESKELAIIYVSTDVEESAMKSVLAQKPWLRMTFHDGSDFAPMAKSAPAAVTELLRGEEFVTAGEIENGQYDLPTEGYADPLEYEYARPLSRAGLTAYFGALRTPTITIYHLPTNRILSRYTTKEDLRKGAIERKMALWKDGRTTGFTFEDFRSKLKWTIFMALCAVFYHAFVAYLGPEYNVLPEIIHRFSSGQFFSQPMPGLNLAASSAKSLGEETLRSISSAAKTLPTVIASKATA